HHAPHLQARRAYSAKGAARGTPRTHGGPHLDARGSSQEVAEGRREGWGVVMRVRALFSWMLARHSIYEQKATGYAKPWTGDPILQQWRFGNVYRELDKETVAIKKLWRDPYRDEPDLWFAMVVARLVNWSPTLRELGYPASRWNPEKFVKTIQGIQQRGGKAWGGAYIVSTNGES